MLCYRHGTNPQTDGGEKDTKAPVTLKGVLGMANPSGAVHIGPMDALEVGELRINPSSGLNKCDKIINTRFPAHMRMSEDDEQVNFGVRFCLYLCDSVATVY